MLCRVGAECRTRQRCGRVQSVGWKTPSDAAPWDLRRVGDFYSRPPARRSVQIRNQDQVSGIPRDQSRSIRIFCGNAPEYGVRNLGSQPLSMGGSEVDGGAEATAELGGSDCDL